MRVLKCQWCGEELYGDCVHIPGENFSYICWDCIQDNKCDSDKEEADYEYSVRRTFCED